MVYFRLNPSFSRKLKQYWLFKLVFSGLRIIIRYKFAVLVLLLSIYHVPKRLNLLKIRNLMLSFTIGNVLIGSYFHDLYNDWEFPRWDAPMELKNVQMYQGYDSAVHHFVSHVYLPQQFIDFPANFTIRMDEDENQLLDNLGRDFDPRLVPILWLNNFKQLIELNGDLNLITNHELPFKWESWLNLKHRLTENPYNVNYKADCDSFVRRFKIARNISHLCEDYPKAGTGLPKFKILGAFDKELPEKARRIYGSTYMLYEAPDPERIMFLGLSPQNSALIIPTDSVNQAFKVYKNELNSDAKQLVNDFITYEESEGLSYEEIIRNGIDIKREVSHLNYLLDNSTNINDITFIDEGDLQYDITRLVNHDSSEKLNATELKKRDFMFDLETYLEDLYDRSKPEILGANMNHLDSKLLSNIESNIQHLPNFQKYFHEALTVGKTAGTHYDWRFFDKLTYSPMEHVAAIHRLSRAWLRFSQVAGIQTWLGHGSMLGWHWNGINMPWDNDLDVQITMKSLLKLARNYNQTLVVDMSDFNSANLGIGRYLLDISSNFYSREKGNGKNAIDARFIDISTGLYVDITALAFTESVKGISIKKKESIEFNLLLDPEYLIKADSSTYDKNRLYYELTDGRAFLYNSQEIFNCRNNHFYTLDELSPLIPTLYEGVRAWVPQGYTSILRREYQKGLTNYRFSNHMYRPVLRLWIDKNVCSKDTIGNICNDPKVLYEYDQTSRITERHKEESFLLRNRKYYHYSIEDEFETFRLDPWVIKRAKRISDLKNRK